MCGAGAVLRLNFHFIKGRTATHGIGRKPLHSEFVWSYFFLGVGDGATGAAGASGAADTGVAALKDFK